MTNTRTHRGMTIIEAVVAIAIFALISSVTFTSYLTAEKLSSHAANKAKALWLAEEGIEASRSIRDQSYASITPATRGIARTNNIWQYSGTSDVTDGFTRSITFSTVDTNTASVTSNVAWTDHGTARNVALSTILTNWHKTIATAATYTTIDTSASCVYTLDSRYLGNVRVVYDGTAGPVTLTQVNTSITSPGGNTMAQVFAPYPTAVWAGSAANAATTTLTSPVAFSGAQTTAFTFRWSSSVSGKNFTINFVFSDGSIKTATITSPLISICI